MFAAPAEVLKKREGSLADVPLPLLLHAILLEERTCSLELTQRQLEKHLLFEDGVPVGCTTNLLHETLGKYLVDKGLISETDYHAALSESVSEGIAMGDLLVRKTLISAFDVYKQMQANLAHTLLDCFRWGDARYRITHGLAPLDKPVRMNAVQLILTGVNTLLPFDTVATHMAFVDEQRFGLQAQPTHPVEELKLSTKDMKLLHFLRGRPNFTELSARTGMETEALMRRLYGLSVLGLVEFADALPEPAAAPPPAAPEVKEAPAAKPPPSVRAAPALPVGVPFADTDTGLRNELTQAFMSSRTQDPFDLLRVPEDTPILAVRTAFLTAADRFSPTRFQTPELREKAEALLISYARAFAELSNPEQLELWRRRRRAAKEKKVQKPPLETAKVLIKSQLLDAHAQMEEGMRRLAADDPKGALSYFEYAFDIEPKGIHLAYRGYARFKLNPTAHKKLALQELQAALDKDSGCDLAYFFIGEIHRHFADLANAEAAYRRAFKTNPKQRKYAELIKAMMHEQKKAAAALEK